MATIKTLPVLSQAHRLSATHTLIHSQAFARLLNSMIFIDQTKKRGRMTAPERQQYQGAAARMGVDLSKEVSESTAVGLVLQNLSMQSSANAAIAASVIRNLR